MWVSNNSKILLKGGGGGGEEEKKVERTPLKNNSIFIDDRFFALALVIRQSVVIYKWNLVTFTLIPPKKSSKGCTKADTQNRWLLYFLDKGDRLWMLISLFDICLLINLYKTQ